MSSEKKENLITDGVEEAVEAWDPYADDVKRGKIMKVSEAKFKLVCLGEKTNTPEAMALKQVVLDAIKENDMAIYWETCSKEFGWNEISDSELSAMKQRISDKVAACDEKIKDAEENLGENDVLDALMEKADYLFATGDKKSAVEAYLKTKEKALSATQGIDITFNIIRIGFFHQDLELLKTYLDMAGKLVEEKGDWDRRNRYKVFSATYKVMTNDIPNASALFLEGVATFTCYEMYDYKDFVFYLVLTGLLSCDRQTIKKEIIDAPEVIAVIDSIDYLSEFVTSFYDCRYHTFFTTMVQLSDRLSSNVYTSQYSNHYIRELRIVAYNQFLQSYKSCTLEAMATAFGVSAEFVDSELSRFIYAGRLAAKIDKVGGVVHTNRKDKIHSQYHEVIKSGDMLLNRVQKLARIINV